MGEQISQMEQVVNVIEQALNLASSKGVYGLKDSSVINQALDLLKAHFTPVNEPEVVESTPVKGKK
jgi:hypothetical protein